MQPCHLYDTTPLLPSRMCITLPQIPVPVWNQVDDNDTIFVPTNLRDMPYDPDDVEFEYIDEYE